MTAVHRNGEHRLYVCDEQGARVGWHDLTTGISRLEIAEHADDFTEAVEAALTAQPGLRLNYLLDRHPAGVPVGQPADASSTC